MEKTLIAPNIYVSQKWLERIGVAGKINRITLQTDSSEQALDAVNTMLENYSGITVTSKVEKINELKSQFQRDHFLGKCNQCYFVGNRFNEFYQYDVCECK